jgi:pimeloyl-ACP methyl ester carboxylesterase
MPQVNVDGLKINYEVQGEGEPLLLIPYLAADNACYAFQLPDYTKHFSCISVDLSGSGDSDKPAGPYSTTHVAGVSLGSAVATHVAARHPARVRSLTLNSAWGTTDAFLRVCLENWRALARGLPTVADAVILGIFPWCFTPEMYAERPEFVTALEDFVRSRPAQPLDAFLAQSQAVIDHNGAPALKDITAPTLITVGAHDLVTSTRFVEPLRQGIANTEVVVFEHLSHAGLHEDPETFNRATVEFMLRHTG